MRGYDDASYGEGFADVYDDWYEGITDVETTVATLASLATESSAGSSAGSGRILELGVGTGRLAIPLAARVAPGVQVHGVDSSPAMLQRLAAKPGGADVSASLGDMSGESEGGLPEGLFTLVFVAYNTFWNLLTEQRQRTCFAEVARRLEVGGAFVVEAFVPDPTLHDPPTQVGVRSISVDRVVLSVTIGTVAEQRAEGHFIDISETDGVRLRPWSVRWVTVDQLDEMAVSVGLSLAERWEAFDRSPFTATSTRHVSVYRKS